MRYDVDYDADYFEGKMIAVKGYEHEYSDRGYIINQKTFQLFQRENIPLNAKILDIGCAYGFFLRNCEEEGFKTYGIDLSSYAVTQAARITKHSKLMVANLENLPFQSDCFDIITVFDTIEHTDSPVKSLREIHRVLAPQGRLFITTPNIASLHRFLKGQRFHAFVDETHIYLFTLSALKFLVEKAGFVVDKVETPFYSLPISLSNILSKILSKTGLGATILLVATKMPD